MQVAVLTAGARRRRVNNQYKIVGGCTTRGNCTAAGGEEWSKPLPPALHPSRLSPLPNASALHCFIFPSKMLLLHAWEQFQVQCSALLDCSACFLTLHTALLWSTYATPLPYAAIALYLHWRTVYLNMSDCFLSAFPLPCFYCKVLKSWSKSAEHEVFSKISMGQYSAIYLRCCWN